MSEKEMNRVVESVREHFHAPGATPREEMWGAIASRLDDANATAEVIDLTAERQKRSWYSARPMGWAVAAAALLVMGVGIGRMTAPVGPSVTAEPVAAPGTSALRFATAEHFDRTESLLTMVRAEARNGAIDPRTGEWAKGLLAQTRLLMDAQDGGEVTMSELLQDLELVLVQIVGVTNGTSMNSDQMRTELGLALHGLDDREILPRLQAANPQRPMSGA